MRKFLLSLMAMTGIVGLAGHALTQEPAEPAEPSPPERSERGRGPGMFLRTFPLMVAIDADQDGEISDKEIENSSTALKGLDKDANGKLTDEELRPNFDRGRGGRGAGAGGPGGARRQQGGPGGPPGAEFFVNRAMEFDADKDGKLSKEELTKMAEAIGQEPFGFGRERGNRGDDSRRPRRPQRPASE